MSDAGALVREIQRQSDGGRAFQVLGPAPAPLGRLRGEYRAQFLVKGGQRKQMREAVRAAIVRFPQQARRTTIDIDPVNVL
jgi:primosomal protein N' (replication factor Y)